MQDTLKPCPFCGGDAVKRYKQYKIAGQERGYWQVKCRNEVQCTVWPLVTADIEELAVARWNTRKGE